MLVTLYSNLKILINFGIVWHEMTNPPPPRKQNLSANTENDNYGNGFTLRFFSFLHAFRDYLYL